MSDRDLGRCPHCGRATGTLMQSHPDAPGLMAILRGHEGPIKRWVMTLALTLLAIPAVTATDLLFLR